MTVGHVPSSNDSTDVIAQYTLRLVNMITSSDELSRVNLILVFSTITLDFFFFFLNDPAPPEISPFPLPAPLPIWVEQRPPARAAVRVLPPPAAGRPDVGDLAIPGVHGTRVGPPVVALVRNENRARTDRMPRPADDGHDSAPASSGRGSSSGGTVRPGLRPAPGRVRMAPGSRWNCSTARR